MYPFYLLLLFSLFLSNAMADDWRCVETFSNGQEIFENYIKSLKQIDAEGFWNLGCRKQIREELNEALDEYGKILVVIKKRREAKADLPLNEQECQFLVFAMDNTQYLFNAYIAQLYPEKINSNPELIPFKNFCIKRAKFSGRTWYECLNQLPAILDPVQVGTLEATGEAIGKYADEGKDGKKAAKEKPKGLLKAMGEEERKTVVKGVVITALDQISKDDSMHPGRRKAAEKHLKDPKHVQALMDQYEKEGVERGWGVKNLEDVVNKRLHAAYNKLPIDGEKKPAPIPGEGTDGSEEDGEAIKAAETRSVEKIEEELEKKRQLAKKQVKENTGSTAVNSIELSLEKEFAVANEKREKGKPVPPIFGEGNYLYLKEQWKKVKRVNDKGLKSQDPTVRSQAIKNVLQYFKFDKEQSGRSTMNALNKHGGNSFQRAKMIAAAMQNSKASKGRHFAVEMTQNGGEVSFRVVEVDDKNPNKVVDVETGESRELKGELYHTQILNEDLEKISGEDLKGLQYKVEKKKEAKKEEKSQSAKPPSESVLPPIVLTEGENPTGIAFPGSQNPNFAINLPKPKKKEGEKEEEIKIPPPEKKKESSLTDLLAAVASLSPSDLLSLQSMLPPGMSLMDALKYIDQIPTGADAKEKLKKVLENKDQIKGELGKIKGPIPAELPKEQLAMVGKAMGLPPSKEEVGEKDKGKDGKISGGKEPQKSKEQLLKEKQIEYVQNAAKKHPHAREYRPIPLEGPGQGNYIVAYDPTQKRSVDFVRDESITAEQVITVRDKTEVDRLHRCKDKNDCLSILKEIANRGTAQYFASPGGKLAEDLTKGKKSPKDLSDEEIDLALESGVMSDGTYPLPSRDPEYFGNVSTQEEKDQWYTVAAGAIKDLQSDPNIMARLTETDEKGNLTERAKKLEKLYLRYYGSVGTFYGISVAGVAAQSWGNTEMEELDPGFKARLGKKGESGSKEHKEYKDKSKKEVKKVEAKVTLHSSPSTIGTGPSSGDQSQPEKKEDKQEDKKDEKKAEKEKGEGAGTKDDGPPTTGKKGPAKDKDSKKDEKDKKGTSSKKKMAPEEYFKAAKLLMKRSIADHTTLYYSSLKWWKPQFTTWLLLNVNPQDGEEKMLVKKLVEARYEMLQGTFRMGNNTIARCKKNKGATEAYFDYSLPSLLLPSDVITYMTPEEAQIKLNEIKELKKVLDSMGETSNQECLK